MHKHLSQLALLLSITFNIAITAVNAADSPAPTSTLKPHLLSWDDLLPDDERNTPPPPPRRIQKLFDDETGPAAEQYGSSKVNAKLDGKLVKLPGFVAPLEMADKGHVKSFFLVPYYGACIHMPPPAPNQIVFVSLAKPLPVTDLYNARWVTGVLSTQMKTSSMADAAYTLTAQKVEEYIEPDE